MSGDGVYCGVRDRCSTAAIERYTQEGALLAHVSTVADDSRVVAEASAEWMKVAHIAGQAENLVSQSGRGSRVGEESLQRTRWTNADGERKNALDTAASSVEAFDGFNRQHPVAV
jgi:single-stranded DNA-binding protein